MRERVSPAFAAEVYAPISGGSLSNTGISAGTIAHAGADDAKMASPGLNSALPSILGAATV